MMRCTLSYFCSTPTSDVLAALVPLLEELFIIVVKWRLSPGYGCDLRQNCDERDVYDKLNV